jgi:transposase
MTKVSCNVSIVSFPRNFVCQRWRKIDVIFGRQKVKIPKQAYTAEFKELAVKRIKDGQNIGVLAKELGLSDRTLRNWVKAKEQGKLNGAGSRVVTAEDMELSRLRVENMRLKRENEILKKATAYFARDVL